MPRKLRVEYAGAIYLVMNRGDRREAIFRDDEGRRRFLGTPREACAKTGWQVHALGLMPNHFQRGCCARRSRCGRLRGACIRTT